MPAKPGVLGTGAIFITGIARGAAVLHVAAAHRILQRAAAPLAREELAAGVVLRTVTQVFTLHRAGVSLNAAGGWKLGVPWDHHIPFSARGLLLIAFVVGGTAVAPISTAHRLWQRATAPLMS